MVLKKPYGFLIKHFKLIHLLLCIPLIYLVLRTGAIFTFLNDYVSADYYTTLTNIAGTYINAFMYLSILLVILLVLAIFFLMRQKEKDTKFYLFLMLYYILLFILISVSYGILNSIEAAEIEAQTARSYRDIAFIVYIPQFFFIIYTALRGIGFNIKKFNFDEDAKELEITDVDSEEFELILGKNNYKYKRTLRRFIREFKYYVLENKITFTILASVVVIALGTVLYLNFEVFHKTYRQTQAITHNHLNVTVTKSILTNMDIGGNTLPDNKYYLAIAVKIKNNLTSWATLDYENFKASVGNIQISPTLDKSSLFPDLGLPLSRDTRFKGKEENTYVLTYEIDSSLINSNINLQILEALGIEVGSITPVYKNVNLNYNKIFSQEEQRTIALGKILELSETDLGMVTLEINNYKMQSSYEYTYGNNLKNKVSAKSSNNTLLILNKNFNMDKYTMYYKSRQGESNFVKDFIKLRYSMFDESKTITPTNLTPKELNGEWVLEIPKEVTYADKIDLLVSIRDKVYVMELKKP